MSGPFSDNSIRDTRRTISKTKVLTWLARLKTRGQDIQQPQNEDPRQADLLLSGDWQVPHNRHRHDKEDGVSDDVRDLNPVVEFGEIHTSAGDLGFPEFLGRDAIEAASHNAAGRPQNDDEGHGMHGDVHVLGGE